MTGEEREATFHDVIDIVFLREVLDNIRIQLEFRCWILDEVLVGSRAFLDFSILNLFRPSYDLVEIDLLYWGLPIAGVIITCLINKNTIFSL